MPETTSASDSPPAEASQAGAATLAPVQAAAERAEPAAAGEPAERRSGHLRYLMWVSIGLLSMIILAIKGKNTASGIGLALVTTGVLLVTTEISDALSSHGLWGWLESRGWELQMMALAGSGLVGIVVGLALRAPLVGLLGLLAVEAAGVALLPARVDKMLDPMVRFPDEDEGARRMLERFEERKRPALLGALMFVAGSLMQFVATVH